MNDTEKTSILIVDDRPENLLVLESLLESPDLNIVKATSGNKALGLMLDYDFALVLLDVQMPDMDGFETAELMRSSEKIKGVPIVFITALGKENKHIFEGYESGAVDYIFKPPDPYIVKSKVDIFVELYKQRHALEESGETLRQTVVKLAKEISERKQAEKTIKQYSQELAFEKIYIENIVESILDSLIVVDPQIVITKVNKATLDLLGYTKDELIEQKLEIILDDAILSGNTGSIKDYETFLKPINGENIPVLVATSVLKDKEDKPIGTVVIARDMMESKYVKELETANRELKEATLQLVQAEKLTALGELTAGVAHELNQPLNGIKIISQSILRDIEKDRFEEKYIGQDLTDIVNLVNRMAEIINHMRIFTRRTEGMIEETIDINTVVEGPFKLLGQQLKNSNIEVIMELAPDPLKIKGDPIRLEQVIMNLITNAKGGLESSGKENMRLEIKTYQADEGQDAVVEVKDNGGGIPEDIQEKIFQPFFTTKEPGKGTGLGLSVSSKIIEEHKGRMELESEVGEGTTFRVILPVIED